MAADEFDLPMIDVPEDAVSPDTIVKFLVNELVRQGRLLQQHAISVVGEVLRRESLGSTGIGRGIAIPHVATDLIDVAIGVVGRSQKPVNWNALDSQPVHTVCLLITPKSNSLAALRALEPVVRRVGDVTGI